MIWLFIALSRQKYRLYRKFSWLSVREPQEDCASTGYLSLGLQNIFYNPLRYQVAYRVTAYQAQGRSPKSDNIHSQRRLDQPGDQ